MNEPCDCRICATVRAVIAADPEGREALLRAVPSDIASAVALGLHLLELRYRYAAVYEQRGTLSLVETTAGTVIECKSTGAP